MDFESRKIKVGNQFALVDEKDFERLNALTWYLCNGYARTDVFKNGKKSRVYMHRLIMSAKKGQMVDHINQSKLDNRRENLRFASYAQNNKNTGPKLGKKFKNVYFDKRRGTYYAQMSVLFCGKRFRKTFSGFQTEEGAARMVPTLEKWYARFK